MESNVTIIILSTQRISLYSALRMLIIKSTILGEQSCFRVKVSETLSNIGAASKPPILQGKLDMKM